MGESNNLEPIILALDIGTSSIRGQLYDRTCHEISNTYIKKEYKTEILGNGGIEIDVKHIVDRIFSCVDDIHKLIEKNNYWVDSIAITTFVGNILGVNLNNDPITPLIPYSDTRAEHYANYLKEVLNPEEIHQTTGCHIHSSYWPARLFWFRKEYPSIFKRVAKWMSLGEYLFLDLFGDTAVSYSVASWNGLLNRKTLDWDEGLLDFLDIHKYNLSKIVDNNWFLNKLKYPFKNRWPKLNNIPWFSAIGDGLTANIGSGCVNNTTVAITIGSTSAVRVIIDRPIKTIPNGLWCYRIDKKKSLLGGALSEGGNVIEWINNLVKYNGDKYLEINSILRKSPKEHRLIFLPLLSGERSTEWDANIRGAICGLSLKTSLQDILIAAMEGISLRIRLIYDLLKNNIGKSDRVIFSGGAALGSQIWIQILSDVIGEKIFLSNYKEASLRGAAIMALKSLGVISNINEIEITYGNSTDPITENYSTYSMLIEKQKVIYDAMKRIE